MLLLPKCKNCKRDIWDCFFLARFYDGVVDLCLSAAAKRDPQNLALHYYKNGEPPEDVQGKTVFMAR